MQDAKLLIKITQKAIINDYEQEVYDARTLHAQLGSQKQFSDWIKNRLQDFIETVDFISFTPKSEKPLGGRPSTEYLLTIHTATHIAMAERTERGKQVRDAFIEAEKQLRKLQIQPQQLSQKEQVLLLARNLIQAEEENQRLQIENTQKEEVIEKFIEAKEHKNYTQTADIIGMPQKKFFEYLRSNSYIEKDGRRPTAKSKTLKIIETKWSESGYERFLVTPKGIGYFKRKISLAL